MVFPYLLSIWGYVLVFCHFLWSSNKIGTWTPCHKLITKRTSTRLVTASKWHDAIVNYIIYKYEYIYICNECKTKKEIQAPLRARISEIQLCVWCVMFFPNIYHGFSLWISSMDYISFFIFHSCFAFEISRVVNMYINLRFKLEWWLNV